MPDDTVAPVPPTGPHEPRDGASPEPIADLFQHNALVIAPRILGAVLRHRTPEGVVAVRLTEVEAYLGPRESTSPDPGAHTYRGKTPRNAAMFGPPARFYVYFTYGMHYCANIVCAPDGTASGLLLRGGEVIEGVELARSRRPAVRRDRELARGPACLALALGIGKEHYGLPVYSDGFSLQLPERALPQCNIVTGPRVGLGGAGGSAEYPWRFSIKDDPTVSRYAAHKDHKPAPLPQRY